MSALPVEQESPQDTRAASGPGLASPEERDRRLATWLQFPRRVVFLLVAFIAVRSLLRLLREPVLTAVGSPQDLGPQADWSISWLTQRPIAETIGERLPATFILLGAAFVVALLLALVATLVAVPVHRLEERLGPVGSILKGLGRMWVFGSAATPFYGMAMLLILIVAVKFKEWGLPYLPIGGMYTITPDSRFKYDLLNRLKHLILPSFVLALFPALLTGQAMARMLTLPRRHESPRLRLAEGLFKGLGILLGQSGGWLSAVMLVESAFSWPGMGRLALDAVYRRDLPVVFGSLAVWAVLILIGRLVAELFRWLERLIQVSLILPQPETTGWCRTACSIWLVATLALLLIPLGVAVAGLTVDRDSVLHVDVDGRQSPPSVEHPWGTDALGRDVRARVLRGGLITLGTVALLTVAVVLPSGLGGALTGVLASRRALWSESLADLLLLPADVLLYIPSLPGAVVISAALGGGQTPEGSSSSAVPSWIWVSLVCALVLLPRAVRAYQVLWMSAPKRKRGLVLGVAGTIALLLGIAYAGFGLVTSLEYLGLSTRPPLPTLGGLVGESFRMLHGGSLGAGIVLWACSLSLYAAADALIGLFGSKEVLARLNE